MSAVLQETVSDSVEKPEPVVVIGTGPVGIGVTEELLKRDSTTPIILYGNEPWEPYNRVQLSALLTGERSLGGINNTLRLQPGHRVVQQHNCEITDIDLHNKTVTDRLGRRQAYRILILATGSRPHVPSIEGIDKTGVYTFRNLNDAEQLMARRTRCRRAVVIGGGLLGLEAARGMQKFHTQVCLVEHSNRLMSRQLDSRAAGLLREHLYRLGIHSILSESVKSVTGDTAVTGIECRSGRKLDCDTLIVATGIRPNKEMARRAGLSVNRGIRVNDQMQTSDPSVYAVGECAEHRGLVYGLVAPGLEQAAIAAHSISGGTTHYTGSLSATQLKVVGASVFSMGRIGETEPVSQLKRYRYTRPEGDAYRKLFLFRNRLVGAIAYGDWPDTHRLQEAIQKQRYLWPWQRQRFLGSGLLWSGSEDESVTDWPAAATVCQCTGVTRGVLTQALNDGHRSLAALCTTTGASSVCGSCKPLLADLLGSRQLEPETGSRTLRWSAAFGLLLALAMLLSPAIPYADSVQSSFHWDRLWRDSLYKQISGFSLLALGVIISLISLRKRWTRLSLGKFSGWRIFHVVVGVLTALILIAHTGLRTGHHLNLLLMLCFTGLLLVGALASGAIGLQHALPRRLGKQTRELSLWLHIALLFPLPALLGFHILKSYWF